MVITNMRRGGHRIHGTFHQCHAQGQVRLRQVRKDCRGELYMKYYSNTNIDELLNNFTSKKMLHTI